MTELRPTKARLALLQAVADGAVIYGTFPVLVDGRRRQVVTARINELRRVGWIRFGKPGDSGERQFEITPAGHMVLDQYQDAP